MLPDPPKDVGNKKFVDSFTCMYLVSVLSAWNAEIVTYPLDLVKTRLQIQGQQASQHDKLGSAPHRGMLRTALGVVREEGISQLWHGIPAVFCRHFIYAGTRTITYMTLKEKVFMTDPKQTYFPVWQAAICGISAGAFAQYISSPAELLKVHLQMEGKRRLMGLPPRVHGMADAFQKTWAAGGVKGLWKGSVPNVFRAALVNLGDLSAYDVSKRFIMNNTDLADGPVVHTTASICAGFIAALMGTPADVVKARIMNQPLDENGEGLLYKGTADCMQKTIHEEGFLALYKGFLPLWIRLAPWALVFWISYEQIFTLIGGKTF